MNDGKRLILVSSLQLFPFDSSFAIKYLAYSLLKTRDKLRNLFLAASNDENSRYHDILGEIVEDHNAMMDNLSSFVKNED